MRLPFKDCTDRLTVLIDRRTKALLERICAGQDTKPSQVVGRLIRRHTEDQAGTPWSPVEPDLVGQRAGTRS